MKITKKELKHIIEEAVMDHMRTPYIGSGGRRIVPSIYGNQTTVPNSTQQNNTSSNSNLNKLEPQANKQTIRQEPNGVQNKQVTQPSNDNAQILQHIEGLETKIDRLTNKFQENERAIHSFNQNSYGLEQQTRQLNSMLSSTERQLQNYERKFKYQCDYFLAVLQQSLQQKRNNNSPHQIH
jgi:chromosome segregation ATPase